MTKCKNEDLLFHGVGFNVPAFMAITKLGILCRDKKKELGLPLSYSATECGSPLIYPRHIFTSDMSAMNNEYKSFEKYAKTGITFIIDKRKITSNITDQKMYYSDEKMIEGNINLDAIVGVMLPPDATKKKINEYNIDILGTFNSYYCNFLHCSEYFKKIKEIHDEVDTTGADEKALDVPTNAWKKHKALCASRNYTEEEWSESKDTLSDCEMPEFIKHNIGRKAAKQIIGTHHSENGEMPTLYDLVDNYIPKKWFIATYKDNKLVALTKEKKPAAIED